MTQYQHIDIFTYTLLSSYISALENVYCPSNNKINSVRSFLQPIIKSFYGLQRAVRFPGSGHDVAVRHTGNRGADKKPAADAF